MSYTTLTEKLMGKANLLKVQFELDPSMSYIEASKLLKHLKKRLKNLVKRYLKSNRMASTDIRVKLSHTGAGALYLCINVRWVGLADEREAATDLLDTLRAKIKNSPPEAFKDRAKIRTLLTWANQEPASPYIPGTSEYVGGVVSIKYRLEDLPKSDLDAGDSTEPLQNVSVMTKFRDLGYLNNVVLDGLVTNLNAMLKKHRRYTEEYTYLVEADYNSKEVKWLIQFPKKEPYLKDSVFAERCLFRMRELQHTFIESFRHIYSEDFFKAVHKWMHDKTFCQNNSQFLKHGSISNVYAQRT